MLNVDFKLANTIVFISFENEFAPCGGLTAVMRMLPRKMAKLYPNKKIILITPYFQNINKTIQARDLDKFGVINQEFQVKFLTQEESFKVFSYPHLSKDVLQEPHNFTIYLIQSSNFFTSKSNPYVNVNDPTNYKLFADSLFLSSTIPLVLKAIPRPSPFLLNLQDWEVAIVANILQYHAQNLKDLNFDYKCVLTIHNPYDHPLQIAIQDQILKLTDFFPLPEPCNDQYTILQYALPKIHAISTVSSQFAAELDSDPLHTKAFAPHLQSLFNVNPVVGIENGNFHKMKIPEILQTVEEIRAYKTDNYIPFLTIMNSEEGKKMITAAWGAADFSDPSIPLILIFGRDDPRQKGYDVAAEMIDRLLQKHGDDYARFVFTPIPGMHGVDALKYLKNLSEKYPRSVLTFPFKMEQGYMELQSAATYILMPSLYEPFGAANEGYSAGVPVIARATGGLIQQVDPHNYADLSSEIQHLVNYFHGTTRSPTGFLYREGNCDTLDQDWQTIVACSYLQEKPIGNPISDRKHLTLFNQMVVACFASVEQAIDLYHLNYHDYIEMIKNGIQILKEFSWEKSVLSYVTKLYE